MKTIWKNSRNVLLLLITMVGFSSCFIEDNSDEDDAAAWSMVGQWYVANVRGQNSPYRRDDTFRFYSNGTFESYDYYTGEDLGSGNWQIQNRALYISFNGWDTDITADMKNFPDNHVILRMYDRDYGEYLLELVRER